LSYLLRDFLLIFVLGIQQYSQYLYCVLLITFWRLLKNTVWRSYLGLRWMK